MTERFAATDLVTFAIDLLLKAGMEKEKARATAAILVEGDLMGHSTHGLQLLGPYLAELESGRMAKTGEPTVIAERPAVLTWNGHYLPGPWLVLQAMRVATDKARQYGTGTVVIRQSHHIACLAAFHSRATDQGLMMILASSDANSASTIGLCTAAETMPRATACRETARS